uniref:DUF3615 domain-containing protein n=1 Tax=Oryza nivara TaxID=4536 RepID=A0A0E0GFW8_ORYNI
MVKAKARPTPTAAAKSAVAGGGDSAQERATAASSQEEAVPRCFAPSRSRSRSRSRSTSAGREEEERVPYYNRLNKKRANMALAWYNENNPEDFYEFTSVLLHDVCNFCDGGVCHVHINFKARNVTTNSEDLFFAELALINNVFDQYSGYTTTACCIIDGNCLGGLRNVLLNGCFLREERYDEKNCYACDEKIKHPTGSTYKGGHYAEDYLIQGIL